MYAFEDAGGATSQDVEGVRLVDQPVDVRVPPLAPPLVLGLHLLQRLIGLPLDAAHLSTAQAKWWLLGRPQNDVLGGCDLFRNTEATFL